MAHVQASKWFFDIDISLWEIQVDHLRQFDLSNGDTFFHQSETGDAIFLVLLILSKN